MMYLRSQITKLSEDGLTERTWWFIFFDGKIKLDEYIVKERPTKRHKMAVVKRYSRLHGRDSNLMLNDVPMNYLLIHDMREDFRTQIGNMPFDYPTEYIK